MKYVIVGAGVAGVEAAREIRRRDSQGEITIIDAMCEDEHSGYVYRPALKEYLAGTVRREELGALPWGILENGNICLLHGKVRLVAAENDTLVFSRESGNGQEEMSFHRLLLAVGAEPRYPPYIGNAKRFSNVFAFRTLEDTVAIKAHLEARDGSCLVIGGGILGVETAELLAATGRSVTLLSRSENLVFHGIPGKLKAKVVSLLEKHGIMVLMRAVVEQALSGDGRMRGLVLEGGRTMDFETVIVCTGVVPDPTLARSAGVEFSKGIHVDQGMRTTRKNIYAAGDCVFMPWAHRETLRLWGPCRQMGQVAGANMAGGDETFDPWPSYYHTMLFDIPLGFFGDYDASRGDHQRVVRETEEGYQELALKDGRLRGASFLGGRPWPPPFLHLMRTGRRPKGGYDQLLNDDFDLESLWYL